MNPPDWTLDIDETGAFRGEEPWAAVVGWLRPGLPGADDMELGRALRARVPGEWPPHATEWNTAGRGGALREALRSVLAARPRSWVVAARAWRGRERPVGGVASVEYAWALRAAFARAALLFRGGPPVRIHARVADRPVAVQMGQARVRSQLHAVYVHAVAADALRGLGTPNVAIVPLNGRFRYDGSVPGIVVADVLANRFGRILRDQPKVPLAALAEAMEATFGVEAMREVGGRPGWALAADGPHEDAIHALAGGRATADPPSDGTFADEQYAAWKVVLT